MITSHPQNNEQLLIDSTVTLTCTSSISSRVKFSWTHNGTNVKRTHLSTSGATSTLIISNVRYSDGGSYVCIVKRGSLSVTSNTATITVYGKLKCSYVNCVIIIIKILLSFLRTNFSTLICKFLTFL